jgi:hypothetical protein
LQNKAYLLAGRRGGRTNGAVCPSVSESSIPIVPPRGAMLERADR